MKFVIAFCLTSVAWAHTQTWDVYKDAGFKKFLKGLNGKTLVCVPTDKEGYKQENKGFYPVKISAKDVDATSATITIKSPGRDAEFGFGGEEFSFEASANWFHIEVGDDGRREFMVKTFEADDEVGCDGSYDDGGITGLNSTNWAYNIAAHGIRCCVE